MKRSPVLLLALFVPFFTHSTVIWNGVMAPGTANATDENVQITGSTWLPNERVTIQALNKNITVSLLNGPHTVYSSDAGQTILALEVRYPYTIEIVVDHDLTLAGVQNNLTLPLLIEERGNGLTTPGLIKWTVADDCNLYFGDPNDLNRSGVLLQIILYGSVFIPRHIFKANSNRDNVSQIKFNGHSALFLVEETVSAPTNFINETVIDASNTEDFFEKINFKDGSGWFFEYIAD